VRAQDAIQEDTEKLAAENAKREHLGSEQLIGAICDAVHAQQGMTRCSVGIALSRRFACDLSVGEVRLGSSFDLWNRFSVQPINSFLRSLRLTILGFSVFFVLRPALFPF
jgi:hypothetical protein